MPTTETEPDENVDTADAPELTGEEARSAWVDAAREVLVETAKDYHAVITQKDLAAEVMRRTGVHTKRQRHLWLGDVLAQVAVDCEERGEPLLSSLCVNTEGSVGKGYATAVTRARGSIETDPDDHAAQERFECHRFFGADLPSSGGVRALTPRLSASRSRERRAAAAEKMPPLCPTCHTAVPATGHCDYCD